MQPHTVALINIACFLHNGGSGSSFRVNVSYSEHKYYNISVSGSGGNYSCRVDGRWSCTSALKIEGSKVTVRGHKHRQDTSVEEVCWLSASSIDGGRIQYSSIGDGTFYGSIRSNGKEISITASTTGRTYNSKIS